MDKRLFLKNVSTLTEERKEEIRWNLVTRQQVAKMLKVSVHTVDNYRKTKGLPFVKIGNSVRFSIPEIVEWIRFLNYEAQYEDEP